MSYYYNNSPYYGPGGGAASAGSSVGSNTSANGFGNYAGFGNSMFAMGSSAGSSAGPNGGSPDLSIAGMMAGNSHGRVTSYSRPSSVSPEMASAYAVGEMSSKARFDASRGFEAEDDLEFCPALVSRTQHYRHTNGHHNHSHHFHHPHHIDNSPVTAIDYSDKSPATSQGYLNAASLTGSPQSAGNGAAARVRKIIQIVDPNTGLKVSSPPTPGKAA